MHILKSIRANYAHVDQTSICEKHLYFQAQLHPHQTLSHEEYERACCETRKQRANSKPGDKPETQS